MSLKQPKTKQTTKTKQLKSNYSEIESLAKMQGVKPFNFDEAIGEGSQLWSKDEFNDFENWLKVTRVADTIRENSK